MTLFDILVISAGIAFAALAAGLWLRHVRVMLARKPFWLLLLMASVVPALGSALVITERHSGTGDLKSYGWPKPFFFAWEGWENGGSRSSCNYLYLAADILFYGALILALAILWRAAASLTKDGLSAK
jgi:hypothetical protein